MPVISFKPFLYKALKKSLCIEPFTFLVSSATGVPSSILPLVILITSTMNKDIEKRRI